MATIRFQVLQGGFSYQREALTKHRFINTPIMWSDDPASGNIDFIPGKSRPHSFNTGDQLYVNNVLVTGSHADKCAFLEANVFFSSGGAAGVASPVIVQTYAAMLVAATGNKYIRIKVLQDENKQLSNTTYEYWPGYGTDWIAITKES